MKSESIVDLLEACLKFKLKFDPERRFTRVAHPSPLGQGIPTLAQGVYRPFSPQLRIRFEQFGRWEFATHGDWLGLEDMENLWLAEALDDWSKAISLSRIASEENWANDAAALFRPDRLSLFACSTIGFERVYLLWLDWEEEPELWVYDSNGELRFADLAEYLTGEVNNTGHTYSRPWKLKKQ